MTSRPLTAVAVIAWLALSPFARSDNAVPTNATVASTLTANVGKAVTLRLGAGEELTGVVRAVNLTGADKAVVLGQLSGREYFDAVIAIGAVQAVIVRSR